MGPQTQVNRQALFTPNCCTRLYPAVYEIASELIIGLESAARLGSGRAPARLSSFAWAFAFIVITAVSALTIALAARAIIGAGLSL